MTPRGKNDHPKLPKGTAAKTRAATVTPAQAKRDAARVYNGLGFIITRVVDSVQPIFTALPVNGNVAIDPPALAVLTAAEDHTRPEQGRYWRSEILAFGAEALLEVGEQFHQMDRLDDTLKINTLSEIGDRVSHALRRRIVFAMLKATDWNLAHCAQQLRLGDASALRREIRKLGLAGEYELARDAGAVRPGGHRKRGRVATTKAGTSDRDE